MADDSDPFGDVLAQGDARPPPPALPPDDDEDTSTTTPPVTTGSAQPVMAIGGGLQLPPPTPLSQVPATPPEPAYGGGGETAPAPVQPTSPPPTQEEQDLAAQQINQQTLADLKGSHGPAAAGIGADDRGEHPSHLPRLEPPPERYNDLKSNDPQLYDNINSVADTTGIPRRDLAAIVYASSDNNPQAVNGNRVGLGGITPQDRDWVDPTHSMDPNDPLANLMMAAEKYKRLSDRFGRGTPEVMAAYYAGPDAVEALLRRHPDDHLAAAGQDTFDFVNKVFGRGDDKPPYGSAESSGEVAPGTAVAPTTATAGGRSPTGFGALGNVTAQQGPSLLSATPPAAPPYGGGGEAGPTAAPPPSAGAAAGGGGALGQILAPLGQVPVSNTPVGPMISLNDAKAAIGKVVQNAAPYIQAVTGSPTLASGGAEGMPATPAAPGTPAAPPPGAPPGATGTMVAGGALPFQPPPAAPAPPPKPTGLITPAQASAAEAPPPAAPAAAIPPVAQVQPFERTDIAAPPAATEAPAPAATSTPAPTTTGSTPPSVSRSDLAVGDSYAAGGINNGMQGSKAQFKNPNIDVTNVQQNPGSARVGATSDEVLRRINALPASQVQGKDVVLSTGMLNSLGNDSKKVDQDVLDQIAALRAKGAKSITVLGGPNNAQYGQVNTRLQALIGQATDDDEDGAAPVTFHGAVTNVASDQLHPANFGRYLGLDGPPEAQRPGGQATPVSGTSSGAGAPAAIPPAAGAPAAPPVSSANPPITRLNSTPNTITPQGIVRANAQGGANGVLTYVVNGARGGSSVGQGWDQASDALERYFISKGDIDGAMKAREYVFQIQHEGSFTNLADAYRSFQANDMQGAAQYLARAHAFVMDNSALQFQVLGPPGQQQIWFQRFNEDTHAPIGSPQMVTDAGIRSLLMQTANPQTMLSMVNQERTTNNTIEHDRATETEATQRIDMERQHYQEQAANYAARTAAQQANAEATRQQRADIAQRNFDVSQAANTQAARAAITKEAIAAYPMDDTTAITPPVGLDGQPLTPQQRVMAQSAYIALRQSLDPNAAQEVTKSLIAPEGTAGKRYAATPIQMNNKPYYAIHDQQGNSVAYIPQADLRTLFPNTNMTPREKARSNLP